MRVKYNMKLIIAGSRNFFDYDKLLSLMDTEIRPWYRITEIVSGGAKGADHLGEVYAKEFGIPLKIFRADWDTLGKAAGPIRNGQMGDYADSVLALWDGSSRGTLHMINYMRKLKKLVFIYNGMKDTFTTEGEVK